MYLRRNVAVLVCLVLTFLACVSGQTKNERSSRESECESQKTCAKCISTPSCKWCSESRGSKVTKSESSGTGPARCAHTNKAVNGWCDPAKVIEPLSNVTSVNDTDFSSVLENQVQLKPQLLKMNLRAGQAQTVRIQYQQALGYPVDLYFLMDLSYSMKDHRDKLSTLGEELATAMMNITTNFKLGFGSFVDKYLLPMTSKQPEWLKNHCNVGGEPCDTPYDYKHQMSLASDYTKFKEQVRAAPISGNIDSPEGGLDALMQAMVCEREIGWRKKARHIIVYSSDATYHIAGDGRLAGLVEPNDERCHVNNVTGFYDHGEILDYPSISQINKIARDNSKNIIFAVTGSVAGAYEELSSVINGSTYGVLEKDSQNVVDLVRKYTEKLTESIKMRAKADKMFVIKYSATSANKDAGVNCSGNSCSGISDKTPINFDVTIEAPACPELPEKRRQTIELELEGIPEKVTIEVDLICDCGDCPRIVKAAACGGRGNLVCGACQCYPGYAHDDCSCTVDNMQHGNQSTCHAPGTNETCSGHGKCNSCGLCTECSNGRSGAPEDKYYGQYCECNDYACFRTDNMPCGGPSRGKCVCNECKCNDGWEGKACECKTEEYCIAPNGKDDKVCSGFGACECGICQCFKESRRSGQYCEECLTCATLLCDKYKDCVECLEYKEGPKYAEGENCPGCGDIELEAHVDIINETAEGVANCPILDSSGCTWTFSHKPSRADESKVFVTAEKEKKCPLPPVTPWGYAATAIGLTLLLGLIGIIIWKVLTMYQDHREWVKFEKERVSANWERGDNPLFREPKTITVNPTFESKMTD